ncbi:response regulator transcription factor [Peptoniphilus sp. GNH]|nr:transcriptional regulatory protein WalR [Clostridiales bacterium KA00134]UHR02311.1 response regulator transcription factor [Peptoniphilus sp. GNH]
MDKILVVDDEKAIADIIKFNLEKEGYEVYTCENGKEALNLLKKTDINLVLLDVMMPVMDGFSCLRNIRVDSRVPVIMLTAKDEEFDRVLGLELGADDYVVKPFSMRELIARVKANLRRRDFEAKEVQENEVISFRDLEVDTNRYEVKKSGKIIDLTLREYELLIFFMKSPDQVFSREELLEKVWGYEYFGDIRTVDVTVRRLREKIEDKDKDFQYILTKRGVGYYFGG